MRTPVAEANKKSLIPTSNPDLTSIDKKRDWGGAISCAIAVITALDGEVTELFGLDPTSHQRRTVAHGHSKPAGIKRFEMVDKVKIDHMRPVDSQELRGVESLLEFAQ